MKLLWAELCRIIYLSGSKIQGITKKHCEIFLRTESVGSQSIKKLVFVIKIWVISSRDHTNMRKNKSFLIFLYNFNGYFTETYL